MAGASNYPKTVDTDTQLIRRVSTDALVIADHNNLVDATESIEQTIGGVDDGTANGGTAAFITGVAHLLAMPSVAIPNPRFPFLPLQSQSWYGVNGAPPASWVLGGSVTPSYLNPRGYARLVDTSTAAHQVAYSTLPALSPLDLVARVRCLNPAAAGLDLGFNVSSAAAPQDGFSLYWDGTNYLNRLVPLTGGTQQKTYQGLVNDGWIYLYWHLASGTISLYASKDGVTWGNAFFSGSAAGSYVNWCVYAHAYSASNWQIWLDFVSIGSGMLPGAV
jgi:hypothetical protein